MSATIFKKIIEQHFWLFGEQYHMLTADKNLKTSLQEYESITEYHEIPKDMSLTKQEASQRIDVFPLLATNSRNIAVRC